MNTSLSTASDRGFPRFLRRSFGRLSEECPAAYTAFCRQAPGSMTVEVDGEAIGLQFGEAEVTLGPPTSGPSVRLATDGATILDLIAGRTSLVDAALAERCRIFGSVPALEAFHRSLITYLKGAVRCPSFPWLLREYQQQRGGTGTARQEHLS